MTSINAALGKEVGLKVGDTVEVITDNWAPLAAERGDRGEALRFSTNGSVIYVYVAVPKVKGGFAFASYEVRKIEADT
ncbi:hypothetical protein [Streptomyces sp. H34-S4]|uniref:hypothetical protein n=1 Tax=Streptomyces sp. H34-S4 TaxID=2996463 RepID=UPI0022722378|nr:hypothetical protein [Streptomyces sp. H34-S4]MCY0933667.1 hypothetical protein [Streptomyces sp. H34-S4]